MRFVLITLFFCFCVSEGRRVGDEEWDHFIFTIMWPQAACLKENSTDQVNQPMQPHHEDSLQHNTCVIPHNTNSWTIHGLWPTEGKSQGPEFCHGAPSFNPDALKIIEDDLEQWWPNMFINTEKFNFWKHEWLKHGSCSYKLASLNSELKYFNQSLSILHSLNMDNHLASSGIVPSLDKTYQVEDVMEAVEKSLKTRASIYCFSKHQWQQQYLLQMEVCMDKNLHLIDCPSTQQLLNNKLQYLTKLKHQQNIDPVKLHANLVNHNIDPVNGDLFSDKIHLDLYNLLRSFSVDLLSLHLQNQLDELNGGGDNGGNVDDVEKHGGLQVGLCTHKPILYVPIVH